jgi:ring-1,2-phenylacetyl-CoA epoxidase subunit PaaE
MTTDITTDTTTGNTTGDPATDSGFVPLVVRRVDHDTTSGDTVDSVVVTFDTGSTAMPFEHGQHLTLRRKFDGTEVRRSYSICSPAPDGDLRVAIKRVPDGVFSGWATTDLRAGDTVEVLPPAGHFSHRLDSDTARRYTFLAAGSGITPVYSIMATILAHEPASRVALLYVNRTSLSTMLLDELHDLRDRYLGRVTINFAFTREQSGGALLSGRPDRGRLDDLVTSGLLPADADHAFLCGPIELIGEAEAALVAAGMPSDRVHREIFTTNQHGTVRLAPQELTETSVAVSRGTATLHGRTSTFELYEGDSVLDAVQRVRPDAPFSCRSGVCSTCQAVVRDGAVEMAVNYGLTDDEVARGYVLTCQSRPTTESLDVDYDA